MLNAQLRLALTVSPIWRHFRFWISRVIRQDYPTHEADAGRRQRRTSRSPSTCSRIGATATSIAGAISSRAPPMTKCERSAKPTSARTGISIVQAECLDKIVRGLESWRGSWRSANGGTEDCERTTGFVAGRPVRRRSGGEHNRKRRDARPVC